MDASRAMSTDPADRPERPVSAEIQSFQYLEKRTFSAREAATAIGVSDRTIRRAILRGDLAATKFAGIYRIDSVSLENFGRRVMAQPVTIAAGQRGAPGVKRTDSIPAAIQPEPLPIALTSLIGRTHEVESLSASVVAGHSRFFTLVGPGGVGKTRLAIEVAGSTKGSFEDGVVFVPLAAVRHPRLILREIVRALGLEVTPIRDTFEMLVDAMRARHLLLVLDNFEHLLDGSSSIGRLIAACPRIVVLVTSRSPLPTAGAKVFAVRPLPTPRELSGGEREIEEYDAVALLVERATSVVPGFEITERNAVSIAQICQRLDGLPLAIELAAPRLRTLTPAMLLDRLDDRLGLLTSGGQDVPERLRSIRGAISWSYELLDQRLREPFCRLAVFVGGFDVDAVERLGLSDDSGIGAVDFLAALIDAALCMRSDDPTSDAPEPRFTMLETIREFAAERFEELDNGSTIRDAHAAYYTEIAETANARLLTTEQTYWFEKLETELPNMRAALSWLVNAGRFERALRLVTALYLFWTWPPNLREGRAWFEEMLRMPGAPDLSEIDPEALFGAGDLNHWLEDLERAAELHAAALANWRRRGDNAGIARGLRSLASLEIDLGHYEPAETLLTESLPLLEATASPFDVGFAINLLGVLASGLGDHRRAVEHFKDALDRFRRIPGEGYIDTTSCLLGWELILLGDYEEATVVLAEGIRRARHSEDERTLARGVMGVAALIANTSQAALAVQLFAAAAAARDALGLPLRPAQVASHDRILANLRTKLGARAFASRWAEGESLGIGDAVSLAEMVLEHPPEFPKASGGVGLTPREIEVLGLVVAGNSDRQISDMLFISRRTASKHVARILDALGVPTRAAAAVEAVRRGLV